MKKRERLTLELGRIVPFRYKSLFPITGGTSEFAKGAMLSFRKSRTHKKPNNSLRNLYRAK